MIIIFALDGGISFGILINSDDLHVQEECSFQHLRVQYEVVYRNENVCVCSGLFQCLST